MGSLMGNYTLGLEKVESKNLLELSRFVWRYAVSLSPLLGDSENLHSPDPLRSRSLLQSTICAMASPQPPDSHAKPPPQPPETCPKLPPPRSPSEQNRSIPLDLPPLDAQLVSPMRNPPQEQSSQGNKDFQLAGEFLTQVSLSEGKEAEHRRNKQIEDNIVEEQEVDLAMIMKSLKIAIPVGIEVGYQGEEIQKPEENSSFQLLMKVACSSGTPRNIPLQPLNEAMAKAWGNNYWIIDQVKHAVYKAYFRDDDAMDFVLKRQPWSLEGDNLLLEWINPKIADKDPDDYRFSFIYVPIRVYGVPQRFRTPYLMQYVIDNVAQRSDIHPPPDIRMVIKDDYISAYAKMDIAIPVQDKIKYYVSPNEYIMFYLNYDKIKRICTFCGLMFHTVQFCPNRRKLILHLQSIGASTASVPFSYVGIWTSQAMKIPQEAFEQAKVIGGLAPQFRKSMKVDKSAKTTSLSLSNFTISDSDSGKNYLQGRESDGLCGSTELRGAKLLSLTGPTQPQLKQKSLLGPIPQVPAKDTEQLNLSTLASCKRQQPSESAFSEYPLKRQATTDLIREQEQDGKNDENKQNLYQPSQLCYGHTSGRKSSLVGERRIIRPNSRSRLDDKELGGQTNRECIPQLSIASSFEAVGASQGSASSGRKENLQGQTQLGVGDNASTQVLCGDFGGQSVDMDFEAVAPAFKAPRAP